jgi:hypothetical protein
VHRQDDADGEACGKDQRRGAVSELMEVPEELAPFLRRTHGADEGARAKGGDRSNQRKAVQHARAETVGQ